MRKLVFFLSLIFVNILSTSAVSESLQLRSLSITGSSLEPKFNSNTTKYFVSVPYETREINIITSTKDRSTQITGDGRGQSVIVGNNIFEIVTRNVEGNEATYTVIVSRQDENGNYLNHKNTGLLRSLSMEEVSIHFNKNQFIYDLDVPHNIESLTLKTELYEKNLNLEIKGNSNFKAGNNVVEIITKSGSNVIRTYKLNVNRAKKPIETQEKNLYYIIRNTKEEQVSIDLNVPQMLNNQTLEYIYSSQRNVVFNYINESIPAYSLLLKHSNISNPNMDLSLETKVDYDYLHNDEKSIMFEYVQTVIPVKYTVEIPANDIFENDESVVIYNELNKTSKSAKVENDVISFDIESGGKYIIYSRDSLNFLESIDRHTLIVGILIFLNFIAFIRLIVVLKK